jgi:SpoVK/Ycf46/Vps4 family AAA+-type ATPase
VPLYRIDMIEIFSGRHGNPEATFVSACRTMEEMAPAVLWFDEIEMGVTSKNDDASGTLGRIFAFFLTWMQEKTRGLFVAATANRIDLLPAEMIRKGRFDEVFFVDLPSEAERLEICRIHLQKRGIDPAPLQIERLLQFTKGWTGAEIEQLVVSSLTSAKLEGRSLESDDLLNTTAKIVPLSQTMKEQVEHIRAWALDRAVRTAPRTQGIS